MRNLSFLSWGYILLFLAPVLSIAQGIGIDSVEITDSSYFNIQASPVFIHASRIANPFSISSIDQEKIKLLPEPTIESLLNSTPGLWMQTGALNTNRISIRGVGYREPFATTGIKVYLDEVPLTNGVGEASIEDIHPLILSGIDIWRGPASALWGSGLGGMIHLKSKNFEKDSWQTRIQLGSYDRLQFDQHLSTQYGKKDQWSTGLHYQYLNDSGYRDNNHYNKHSVTWSQNWKNENGWSVNSFIHGIALKAYIPSSLNLEDYENNPSASAPTWAAVKGNEDYTKWITGLNFSYNSSKNWVYRGSVFGNFFESDEVRPFNILEENSNAYGTRHRFTFQLSKNGHIATGIEYFNERYSFSTYETLDGGIPGMKLTDQTEDRSYFNGFIQSDWSITDKWFVFAGLTAAYSQLSDENLESNIPWSVYPTIGMNYTLLHNFSISGSFSRGYSALSLDDMLQSDGSLNEDIVPETGWNGEVSVILGSGLDSYVKATAFSMNIENTIITRRIMDDQFEKLNGGSTLHQGIELEYRWITTNKRFSLEGNYTYSNHRFDEFVDQGIDYGGNHLPGIPNHRTFNRLNIEPLRKFGFYMEHHFVSEVYLNDANSVKGDGYNLVNTGINYEILSRDSWTGTLSAHVHNVFDSHYSSMFQINAPGTNPRYYYPGKPRAFYLTFSLDHDL